MVTFAQAQERAEEWINGDVPGYQHRAVRVREFDLGFVVWAEDRENGPVSDGGSQRLVIARDSGEATLWPGLPVGEVIRRYEEEYGLPDAAPEDTTPAPPPERVDLNQTSFLLSPPEWLQEAADKLGIPDRRSGSAASAASSDSASGSEPAAPDAGTPWPAAPAVDEGLAPTSPGTPAGATPWAGTDTNADDGEDLSVPAPATVFAPPLVVEDDEEQPRPSVAPEAKTALMHGGSQLPKTALAPALGGAPAPAAPGEGASGASEGPGGSNAPQPPAGSPTPQPPAGSPAPPPSDASAYGYPQGPGASNPAPPPSDSSAYGYPQGPGGANVPQPPAGSPTPQPPAGSPAPPPSDASAYG
ncbi:SUKH-4 family immunity protein, partial [Streptomyces formicae]